MKTFPCLVVVAVLVAALRRSEGANVHVKRSPQGVGGNTGMNAQFGFGANAGAGGGGKAGNGANGGGEAGGQMGGQVGFGFNAGANGGFGGGSGGFGDFGGRR